MSVTNLPVKKTGEGAGPAPLRNLNILDELVVRARDRAKHLPGIVTFSGPSGFGKSTAAAWIAARHQARHLEVRSTWTRKALLENLLRQMGVQPRRTVNEMMEDAANEMVSSGRPLIIDEFDHAIDRGLVELVRDLYEASNVPIVVIGEERLPQKLQKWERFHGRVMDWRQAQPANSADAEALNSHYIPDMKVRRDLLERITAEARGSVRRIVTNLDLVTTFAKGEGLKNIGSEEWGDKALHSAVPPEPRGAKQMAVK